MARYIHLADNKGRDAEVLFFGKTKKSLIRQVTLEGAEIKKLRILKGTTGYSFESIASNYQGDARSVSQALLDSDPDIDLQMAGCIIGHTTKVYIGQDLRPVSVIQRKEFVYAPDGTLAEERTPKELLANILSEHPLRLGKMFAKKDIYNKLVFAKKYQIKHVNGLTFDFLYGIAQELHEKESLMMLGAGPKGAEPIVFQDGGKSYRAFLEGRVKGDSYILLLHLSNLELKSVT